MSFYRTARCYLSRLKQLSKCYVKKWRNKKAVYLIMTPTHGNLGDHAITQAETLMLERLHIPYIDVPTELLKDWEDKDMLHAMNGRTILINGGGNLGTIWFSLERVIRGVIQANPKSRILILPNTMYYHDDERGREELEASKAIYNAHPSLTVYAREKTTYDLAKKLYDHVKLVPDLALALNYSLPAFERDGCVMCLRSDKERTRTEEDEAEIMRQTRQLFGDKVRIGDMNVNHAISPEDREEEIKKQCDLFKKAQVVVTDRLHGMIFCAITGTPCVVINSQSPKVKGCYEWIKDLDYIRFCEDIRQLSAVIQSLPEGNLLYDNAPLLPYFRELESDIQSCL